MLICMLSAIIVFSLLYLKEIIQFFKQFAKNTTGDELNSNDGKEQDQVEVEMFYERLLHMPTPVSEGPVSYQMFPSSSIATIETENYKGTSSQIFGVVKILYFLFQPATIIRVHCPEKGQLIFPTFFNF